MKTVCIERGRYIGNDTWGDPIVLAPVFRQVPDQQILPPTQESNDETSQTPPVLTPPLVLGVG